MQMHTYYSKMPFNRIPYLYEHSGSYPTGEPLRCPKLCFFSNQEPRMVTIARGAVPA